MKKFLVYTTFLITMISGCQSFIQMIIGPMMEFYFLHLLNSLFIDEVAKDVTCFYYQHNKFPASHIEILPLLSPNSIGNNKVKDNTFLRQDSSFKGIAKYDFELNNYLIITSITDTTDSSIDSIRIYKCIGTLIFADSIFKETERSFIIEILITDIIGSLYRKKDSTYFDDYISRQMLNSTENYGIFKDTIAINKSCQEGYGVEIITY
jgi:hypothetical protein